MAAGHVSENALLSNNLDRNITRYIIEIDLDEQVDRLTHR